MRLKLGGEEDAVLPVTVGGEAGLNGRLVVLLVGTLVQKQDQEVLLNTQTVEGQDAVDHPQRQLHVTGSVTMEELHNLHTVPVLMNTGASAVETVSY